MADEKKDGKSSARALTERPAEEDPASGTRKKGGAAATLQLALAEFARRSEGKTGAELQAEVDKLLDRLIQRHVETVPPGLRDELRELLYGMMSHDPTLGALVEDLRKAAARDAKK